MRGLGVVIGQLISGPWSLLKRKKKNKMVAQSNFFIYTHALLKWGVEPLLESRSLWKGFKLSSTLFEASSFELWWETAPWVASNCCRRCWSYCTCLLKSSFSISSKPLSHDEEFLQHLDHVDDDLPWITKPWVTKPKDLIPKLISA